MPEPAETQGWIQYLSLGTLLAAAIGAFAANFAAEFIKAQVRKSQLIELHRDADIAAIQKCVTDLQALAEEYWSSSAAELGKRDAVLAAKIVATQSEVLRIISLLFSGAPKHDCDASFTYAMAALSGGDFKEPTRLPAPSQLTDIFQTCQAFAHLVTRRRRELRRGWLA